MAKQRMFYPKQTVIIMRGCDKGKVVPITEVDRTEEVVVCQVGRVQLAYHFSEVKRAVPGVPQTTG
jgi:ribosomal protein L24